MLKAAYMSQYTFFLPELPALETLCVKYEGLESRDDFDAFFETVLHSIHESRVFRGLAIFSDDFRGVSIGSSFLGPFLKRHKSTLRAFVAPHCSLAPTELKMLATCANLNILGLEIRSPREYVSPGLRVLLSAHKLQKMLVTAPPLWPNLTTLLLRVAEKTIPNPEPSSLLTNISSLQHAIILSNKLSRRGSHHYAEASSRKWTWDGQLWAENIQTRKIYSYDEVMDENSRDSGFGTWW